MAPFRFIGFGLIFSFLFIQQILLADTPVLSNDETQSIQRQFQEASKEPGAILFTPPSGWRVANPKALPKSVKAMVVGKGAYEFPPSINLSSEIYDGTLKQYLKRVKEINDSRGAQWKDLGKISTEAGPASLSQVDTKTQWGDVRMMHVILKKENTIYIVTASALQKEFPKFYKDFFNSLKSLHFNQ